MSIEIGRCPNPKCTSTADVWMHGHANEWYVECTCGYHGPWARTKAEAIELHNAMCRQPTPEAALPANEIPTLAEMRELFAAHPPKPEPTEPEWMREGEKLARLWESHTGDSPETSYKLAGEFRDFLRRFTPAAPKPQAEWMAEAAREIRAAYVAFSVGAGAQPMYDHIERIIAKHLQHAPKVPA